MGKDNGIKIPDYRIYQVDGVKKLEWTRDALAKHGLKDPWLRNEVWRYEKWPGYGWQSWKTFKRGMKWAGLAMIVTIAADKMLGISAKKEHH